MGRRWSADSCAPYPREDMSGQISVATALSPVRWSVGILRNAETHRIELATVCPEHALTVFQGIMPILFFPPRPLFTLGSSPV